MTTDENPTPFTREFFRKAGEKGGTTRAKRLTAKQRSASAKKAAKARWAKRKADGTR